MTSPSHKKPLGVLGWLVLTTITLTLLFILGMNPWFLMFIATAVSLGLLSQQRKERRLTGLAILRKQMDLTHFMHAFEDQDIDPLVVQAVYTQLQDYMADEFPDFPVMPDDRIVHDLGIDTKMIGVTLCEDIAGQADRSINNLKESWLTADVKSVRELVEFINQQDRNRDD
ncbi:hypothetical protein ACFL6N_04960 [Thermodesulfobacteriota bacterium]